MSLLRDGPRPLPPRPMSPVLGAVHARHRTDRQRDVHHQGNQAGQGTEDVRHGDPQGREHHAIGLSIRPDTVLVAHVCDGGLLLHGWRDRADTMQQSG